MVLLGSTAQLAGLRGGLRMDCGEITLAAWIAALYEVLQQNIGTTGLTVGSIRNVVDVWPAGILRVPVPTVRQL